MPFAGTMRGKVECFVNTGSWDTNLQNLWTSLWGFLVHHPRFHEVACYRGTGTSADTVGPAVAGSDGTQDDPANWVGYHDSAKPFGNQAWSLFRWDHGGSSARSYDRYVLIQVGWGNNAFGTGANSVALAENGNAGYSSGSICVATCIVDGTPANAPMNFTGTFGAQAKTTPVWSLPTGSTNLWVFPRSNNGAPGVGGNVGAHATNKQNMSAFINTNSGHSGPCRASFISDDDGFLLVYDRNNDSNYVGSFIGQYVPRTGLTVAYPELVLPMNGGIPVSTGVDCGNTNGDGSPQSGGILLRDSASGVRNYRLDRLRVLLDSVDGNQHPNKLTPSSQFDEFPYNVYASETPSVYGYAGQIDWIREIYGVSSNDMSLDQSRAFFGNSAATSNKVVAPWLGTASPGPVVPGTGTTRQGINFP